MAGPTSTDQVIATWAARQRGLVTRAQLLAAGVRVEAVKYGVRAGHLRPRARGVYQVGPVAQPHAAEVAALLLCGPDAVISHRSAALLWQMLPRPSIPDEVEVTIPGRDRRRRLPGIVEHRSERLTPEQVTVHAGIPVTTPARTLLDLTGVVPARMLERALAYAEREGLIAIAELSALLEHHRGRRGIAQVRSLLRQRTGPAFTLSEAEEHFLAMVRRAALPPPQTNVKVGRHPVDLYWPEEQVVVEVDGFAHHGSRVRFESDRLRDAELSAAGVQVIRVTWRQMVRQRDVVLVNVARTLGARSGR